MDLNWQVKKSGKKKEKFIWVRLKLHGFKASKIEKTYLEQIKLMATQCLKYKLTFDVRNMNVRRKVLVWYFKIQNFQTRTLATDEKCIFLGLLINSSHFSHALLVGR
jgi:hypothetical protein